MSDLDLPYDVKVMILQCMNGKDRLELGLVDKEWYEASQDAILWRVLRLGSKMVEEEDIKVLKRLLHRRQPKTVLMAKTQLTPQLLRVLAECPSLEELFFDFCVTKTDSDILTLCCKPDSDLKVIRFVGCRLFPRSILTHMMNQLTHIVSLETRTEPRNASEAFWGASVRSWTCNRDAHGVALYSFSKNNSRTTSIGLLA